ncbi:MAG: hypothetical protein V4687_03010 [Bacteroidota bacterium]
MAKLRSGIFGPISGKIGNLVGGIWKGIAYQDIKPKQKRLNARLSS